MKKRDFKKWVERCIATGDLKVGDTNKSFGEYWHAGGKESNKKNVDGVDSK